MSHALLETRNLESFYGDFQALFGVDFTIAQGEIVAIIGANGAGKSSLIRTIAGIEKPRSGKIFFHGKEIQNRESHVVCDLGIGQVAEGRQVFPTLSVHENLEMGGYIDQREFKSRVATVYARLPLLAQRRSLAARSLSGGQRQTLAVGMALMLKPRVLLLDEPSAGLSPAAAADLFDLIKGLHTEGMTIVMVEQNALEALNIADRAYLLVDGQNARDGVAKQLAADEDIRHAFLGA